MNTPTHDATRRTAVRDMVRKAAQYACAAVVIPEQPCNVLIVDEGEEGYRILATMTTHDVALRYADGLNRKLGVSPAFRDYLLAKSMNPAARTSVDDYADAREYGGS